MSFPRAGHPVRLPWFADGRVEPDEAAAIERHLHSCDACRAEVEALRSLYRSLRQPVADHVPPETLVAFHDGALAGSDAVESHLRECPACSADLAELDRSEARSRGRRAAGVLGAAASILIVVAAGWLMTGSRRPASAPLVATRVVFPAAQRGGEMHPRLHGRGPWVLEVWAPLRTAPSYAARIRSAAGEEIAFEALVGPASPEGKLRVPVTTLAPGSYVLVLSPIGGDGETVHGFEVDPQP